MGFLTRKKEERQASSSYNAISFAGGVDDSVEALASPIFYSLISMISNDIAGLPLQVFARAGKKWVQEDAPDWLEQPSPESTSYEFWNRYFNSLLMHGNAFVRVFRNGSKILELILIDPSRVFVERTATGAITYTVAGEVLTKDEVLHVKYMPVGEELLGVSPIDTCRNLIKTAVQAQKFSADFYTRDMQLTGIIEHPGDLKEEEAMRLLKGFVSRRKGKNGESVALISNGASFKPLQLSPQEAQYEQTVKIITHQACAMFHVPAFYLDPNVANAYASGVHEQKEMYVSKALKPFIEMTEEAFSQLLPTNRKLKFNVNGLMRTSPKERSEYYHNAIQDGWMTRSEVRELEDREADSKYDAPLMPQQMASAELYEENQRLKNELLKKKISGALEPGREDFE